MVYDIKISKNSTKFYYVNNVLHREDGPAIEDVNGNKYWYKNGLLHREDGPAIEKVSGYNSWNLNGKQYGIDNDFTNESWKKFIKTLIFR